MMRNDMNEKLNDMKRRIGVKKKGVIGTAAALAILITVGGMAYAVSGDNADISEKSPVVERMAVKTDSTGESAVDKNGSDQVDETGQQRSEKQEEKKNTTKEQDKETADQKKKEDSSAEKTAEKKTQTSDVNTSSSSVSENRGSGDSVVGSQETSSSSDRASGSSSGGAVQSPSKSESAPAQSQESSKPSQSEPVQSEPAPSKPQAESKPAHTHNWQPQYSTVSTYVVDQAAWDETVSEPIYETQIVWYCNTCGADITADPEGHLDETMHGGYRSDSNQVQTGTNTYTIHHDEVGHYEDSQVLTGYVCSCGATK
ncbi:MAG TPA: hypothetical protein H9909_06065 [Candidatus Mediterraneibacter norfolkensis]|nr:hypothetical protein [Candidatus Mediterraneibacter norfolkensis]